MFKVGDRVRPVTPFYVKYNFTLTPEYIGSVTRVEGDGTRQMIWVTFDRRHEHDALREQERAYWFAYRYELVRSSTITSNFGIVLTFTDVDDAIAASTKIAAALGQPVEIKTNVQTG